MFTCVLHMYKLTFQNEFFLLNLNKLTMVYFYIYHYRFINYQNTSKKHQQSASTIQQFSKSDFFPVIFVCYQALIHSLLHKYTHKSPKSTKFITKIHLIYSPSSIRKKKIKFLKTIQHWSKKVSDKIPKRKKAPHFYWKNVHMPCRWIYPTCLPVSSSQIWIVN